MCYLLRKISKAKWLPAPWTDDPTAIQAEALADLKANGNELSFWSIETDKANLDDVLVALAAEGDRIDKLDYVLIECSVVEELGIPCVHSEGKTPHVVARKEFHRDLVNLTVQHIAGLAGAFKARQPTHERVPANRVRSLLRAALAAGQLERADLKPVLLAALGEPQG
jgi:hypothetical protein